MTYNHEMTNIEAIEELKKVDTLDMPLRLCKAHYMAINSLKKERTGHWIDDENGNPHCSVCGGMSYRYDFCPCCGARMFKSTEQVREENK